MSKTGDQIYFEREDMVLSKLTREETLVYNLMELAEGIADGYIDAEEWLDDITEAADFIRKHINQPGRIDKT